MITNPITFGIPPETDFNERRKLIIVNLLNLMGILFNLSYFFYLLSQREFLMSMFNLSGAFFIGITGFYLMKTKRFHTAKVFILISTPLILALFTYLYGDLGFHLIFVLLSICSFFVLNKKMAIYLINFWILCVYLTLMVGIEKGLLIPTDENMANFASHFYWSNLIFGFICIVVVLSIFKSENIRYELSINEQNKKITKQNEDLLQLNKQKNTFITAISHDLKNPFSAILGLLSILKKDYHTYEPEKLEKFITVIHSSANHTFNLLEDLLMWGKLQMEHVTFEPQNLNLSKMCQEVNESLQDNIHDKKLKVHYNIPELTEVVADSYMLKTIFRNLISNAVKFSKPEGEIAINTFEQNGKVVVSVSDNGIGMKSDVLSCLFTNARSSEGTCGEHGTGIGLYLCKICVEKHNETIWAESQDGMGSTFSFSLKKA
jgi:signal transduction histidine kinase